MLAVESRARVAHATDMNPLIYSILHVVSGFVLVGYTFSAFAAPNAERRGFHLMITGIASLVMVVAGVGLLHKGGFGWPMWALVKVGCWLLLSGLAGIAFRAPSLKNVLALIAVALVTVAVYCAYMKPALG